MADTFLYEDSNEPQVSFEPFVKKDTVWVIDQNNGSYSGGQVQIDSSALSNSGKYVSYSDAYFTIPLVIRMTATSANAQVAGVRNLRSAFAVGLKSYTSIISSMSVEYNNTSVVQLTSNLSHYVSFKMLTSFSQDSLKKFGALLGFFPDGGLSTRYGAQSAADVLGHGSINNFNLPQFPASVYSWDVVNSAAYNEGLYQRQVSSMSFDPTSPAPAAAFISAGAAGQIGLNYFRLGTGGDVDSKYWFVTAIIRLKDLADFFDKLVLVKGAFLRFTINLNQATHNFSITTNAGAITDISVTQNILSGGTTPLMLANASQSGNGLYQLGTTLAGLGNATYTFQLACNVARDPQTNVQHPTFSSVRLWANLWQMNPVQEEQYLTLNKIKTIRYNDLYNYAVTVTCSGTPGSLQGQFTQLLTNGVPNPQYLIIVPFIGTTANNSGNGTAAVAPYGSPFASEPSTTSPFITLTQFNVQVAGVNIYNRDEQYAFEDFTQELAVVNAINGAQVDGLNSGLIGYQDFYQNKNYWVIDLSRRLPAENAVPKSVQISGTVLSGTVPSVELQCFLVWGREIAIDLETGAKLA